MHEHVCPMHVSQNRDNKLQYWSIGIPRISQFCYAKGFYQWDIVFHVPRTNLSTQNFLEFVRSPLRGGQGPTPYESKILIDPIQ